MAEYIPMRQCVACRTRRPQAAMIRLWRDADGQLSVAARSPRVGRGAYCCPTEACIRKTLKKGLFGKSLRTMVEIKDADAILGAMMAMAAALNKQRGDSEHGENHG